MNAFKCLPIAVVVAVAAVLIAAPAMAGDYHYGTQLICSDCHVMHYSVSHSYAGGAAPGDLKAGGPFPRLLKASANDLCLQCHDGSSNAPDVLGDNTGTAYVREAGALNRDGGGPNSYQEWMGHSLGSPDPAPGSNPSWSDANGLTCTDCHGAHNSISTDPTKQLKDIKNNKPINPWRNLLGRAGNSSGSSSPDRYTAVSYEVGANTGIYDVSEGSAALNSFTTHYAISNVDFEEPVTTDSGMGHWCMKCHTDFHGNTSSGNMYNGTDWLRHPTAGVDLSTVDKTTRWDTLTNHVKLMGAGGTATPTCISCHKAHGNQNAFGLIYMAGAGTVTEDGDDGTGMRDLCRQCHNKGE